MAADLPTEIIQSIFCYLDVETYHSARQACYTWRSAASASSMLRDVLQQVPVSLPHKAKSLTTEEWNAYFGQVACLNLLGSRNIVEKTVSERKLPQDSSTTPVLAFSGDGRKIVGLKGSQAVVHDRETGECLLQFALGSSLYPHWTSVCRALMETRNAGYMPVNQRYAKHRIAASSDCSFVAIGLGRVVQVYSLHEHENGAISTPAEYVLGQTDMVFASTPGDEYEDTDGVVDSLEFIDNDTLLRVAIGKETTIHRPTRVRYLGQPSQAPNKPDLAYWRKTLNHIYIDSASLAVTLTGDDEYRSTFRGLRLLPRSFHIKSQHAAQQPYNTALPVPTTDTTETLDRFFVASLQTGHTDSYCIGQIIAPSSTPPQTVRIHRLFPSIYFRPSNIVPGARTEGPPRLYPPAPGSERAHQSMTYNLCDSVSRWNAINLPSATFSSPLLAASDDQRLLVVYEPGAGHSCCIVDGGSLYVYSMQDCTAVYQPAQEPLSPSTDSQESGSEDSGIGVDPPESIYDRLRMTSANPFNDDRYEPPDIIPCWPFLLDRTSMDIESLQVVRSDKPSAKCGARTERGGGCWYTVTGQSGSEMIQWQFTSN